MNARYPTASLHAHGGEAIRSSYWLTESVERTNAAGSTYHKVLLEDASGLVQGFIWEEYRGAIQPIAVPSVVEVDAKVKIFDDKPFLHVRNMRPMHVEAVILATNLLPVRRCPPDARAAFQNLAKLEQSLPDPLQGFLRRILLDARISIPILRCRASVRHHHSQIGGLLIHSTSALDMAAQLAQWALSNDPTAMHIAALGYFLHDLGKLRTVGETRRPAHALIIRHEMHTLLMLAPHLRWLESQDAELCTALEYVLSWVATPAKARGICSYLVAELVTVLDTWSAAGHNVRDLAGLLEYRHLPRSRTPHLNCVRSRNIGKHVQRSA